jgi:hypothetical protein
MIKTKESNLYLVAPTMSDIQPAIKKLEYFGIKENIDFSFMLKYHEVTILTRVKYADEIKAAFNEQGINITNIFTF